MTRQDQRCALCGKDLEDATDYVLILAQREHHDASIHVLASKDLLRYCPEHSPYRLTPCNGDARFWKEPA